MTDIAKIFWTGRSQAVRLPKAYRFNDQEVHIYHRPDGAVVLEPVSADRVVQPPADAAAAAIDRLREAIGAGLASGPIEQWDAEALKRDARTDHTILD